MKRHARLLAKLLLTVLLLLGCSAAGGTDNVEMNLPDEPRTEASAPLEKPMESAPDRAAAELTVTVTIEDGGLLSDGERRVLEDFMIRWYRSVGSFEIQDFGPVFRGEEEALRHAASCRTQAAIRAAAPEDLHLTDCQVTLTVTDVSWDIISAKETTVMQFAGLPGIRSELFDLPHIFAVTGEGETCRILYHEADDNPYSSFSYDEETGVDSNFDDIMANIAQRRALPREPAAELKCDHPYDRQAALQYMLTYADHRNEEWHAYDDEGGNCMNFGSQVLLAGGIPMDYSGYDCWYSDGEWGVTDTFVNVGWFMEYAECNTGYGLVADADANYYSGEVGDLLLVGIDGLHHTTEICGLVRDEAGQTIDYLLCSNTTNYRNFPAGTYYYTGHWLVKIYGWND